MAAADSRGKVNSRSPASSRLSATPRHLSRHLPRNALRFLRASQAEAERYFGLPMQVFRMRCLGTGTMRHGPRDSSNSTRFSALHKPP